MPNWQAQPRQAVPAVVARRIGESSSFAYPPFLLHQLHVDINPFAGAKVAPANQSVNGFQIGRGSNGAGSGLSALLPATEQLEETLLVLFAQPIVAEPAHRLARPAHLVKVIAAAGALLEVLFETRAVRPDPVSGGHDLVRSFQRQLHYRSADGEPRLTGDRGGAGTGDSRKTVRRPAGRSQIANARMMVWFGATPIPREYTRESKGACRASELCRRREQG